AGRPVLLDRVRAVPGAAAEAGVLCFASGEQSNRFVTIRNGRFEGPGKAGVRVDGPAVDLEVTNNRFYNLSPDGAGVVFTRPGGRATRAAVLSNSFYLTPAGVRFDGKAEELGAYELKLSLNYFARTGELLKAPGGGVKLTAADNFCDPASGPGALPAAGFKKIDAPTLPDPNPNDDAAFMRFPGPAPMAGATRAGAQ
ncbi:MAG: hypothetical protein K2V38_22430, partial [Gemmataceae bacterium]|nr:hypothetical protein [Gemmataceae bacterium]